MLYAHTGLSKQSQTANSTCNDAYCAMFRVDLQAWPDQIRVFWGSMQVLVTVLKPVHRTEERNTQVHLLNRVNAVSNQPVVQQRCKQ